jgi:hypothetical protein
LTFFPSGSDLFLFYVQVNDLPYCPGLAFDRVTDHPNYMWQLYNDSFSVSLPGGDWMIRGHICPAYGISEADKKPSASIRIRSSSITGPRFEVEFLLDHAGEVVFSFFDVNGRLRHYESTGALDPGLHRRRFLFDQPAGVYFIKVNSGSDVSLIRKIVLIR